MSRTQKRLYLLNQKRQLAFAPENRLAGDLSHSKAPIFTEPKETTGHNYTTFSELNPI